MNAPSTLKKPVGEWFFQNHSPPLFLSNLLYSSSLLLFSTSPYMLPLANTNEDCLFNNIWLLFHPILFSISIAIPHWKTYSPLPTTATPPQPKQPVWSTNIAGKLHSPENKYIPNSSFFYFLYFTGFFFFASSLSPYLFSSLSSFEILFFDGVLLHHFLFQIRRWIWGMRSTLYQFCELARFELY